MPLVIRGKLGTSKIDRGDKFQRSHVCLHSHAGNRLYRLHVWHILSILIYFENYATIIVEQKLIQVIKSNKIENTKKNSS